MNSGIFDPVKFNWNKSKYKTKRAVKKFTESIYSEEDLNILNASCNCICDLCGEIYIKHPMDETILSYDNQPFLHILCNGQRVKL